ncbi:hypothetical protein B7460_00040, partial [Klebsiella pneumoniae]
MKEKIVDLAMNNAGI